MRKEAISAIARNGVIFGDARPGASAAAPGGLLVVFLIVGSSRSCTIFAYGFPCRLTTLLLRRGEKLSLDCEVSARIPEWPLGGGAGPSSKYMRACLIMVLLNIPPSSALVLGLFFGDARPGASVAAPGDEAIKQ